MSPVRPPVLADVWFLNVGQGDCTLVIDRETRLALLIDCPSGQAGQLIHFAGQHEAILDTAIVTHWDVDHYGGVARIASATPPRQVLYNHDTLFADADSPPHGIRTTLLQFLELKATQTTLASATDGRAGMMGSVAWQLIAPTHRELTQAYIAGERNVASCVTLLEIGPTRILVGGDAVGSTWSRLLDEGRRLDADILRWPHHGADLHGDETGEIRDRVLEAIRPRHVVVSTGSKNRHGHPSAAVVNTAASKATVLCTQVTPGCFGYRSRAHRNSSAGKASIAGHSSLDCAGHIRVAVTSSGMSLQPSLADLDLRIAQWPMPLCRQTTRDSAND